MVSEALRLAGNATTIVSDLSINASRIYRDLLTEEIAKIKAFILAARNRFQLHNFAQAADLTARRQAIIEAQTAAGGLGLLPEVTQVYTRLLAEELVDVNAAEAHFNSHRFAEIDRILVRRKTISEAQIIAGSSDIPLQSLSLGASQIYRALLSQELIKTDAAIAAGQTRFNAHQFASIGDFIARRQAIINAQAAASGLGLSVDAAQIYSSLLEQEFVKIDTYIGVGQACFNVQHFSEIPDVGARRKAFIDAQAAVAGLELTSEAAQLYSNLLTQELARNDAIIAEQRKAKEVAEAARRAAEKESRIQYLIHHHPCANVSLTYGHLAPYSQFYGKRLGENS